MRELSLKRQSRAGAGLRQKFKWAIYEEKHFRRLIDDVSDLVDGLVDLFPAARNMQRRLCEMEVSEMMDEADSLPVLKSIVADRDAYLEAAVAMAMEDRKGHSYKNIKGSDRAKLRSGDEVFDGAQVTGRSHTYEDIFGSDNAIIHMGNSYGGKSVFD